MLFGIYRQRCCLLRFVLCDGKDTLESVLREWNHTHLEVLKYRIVLKKKENDAMLYIICFLKDHVYALLFSKTLFCIGTTWYGKTPEVYLLSSLQVFTQFFNSFAQIQKINT